jgi:hypothetical protein
MENKHMWQPKRTMSATEIFSNPKFVEIYLKLHDQIERGELKVDMFEQEIKLLEDLPIHPYELLHLEHGKDLTEKEIDDAFMAVVRGIDKVESIWRSDRGRFLFKRSLENEWTEKHVQFYHLVMMLLIKRAYLARELLLIRFEHL